LVLEHRQSNDLDRRIHFAIFIEKVRRTMVKLRLRRVGAKKQASFRIVAADSKSPRDGRFIEVVGFYNPRTEPETVQIKEDRALHWLSVGAQPTEAVARLLKKMGTMERFERLKKGESVETLVAEAEAAAEAAPAVSPKTRRESAKAAAKKAEKPTEAPEKEAPKEPEAESETEEAPEVETEASEPEAPEADASETETSEAETSETEASEAEGSEMEGSETEADEAKDAEEEGDAEESSEED
jgi:small subunit ribosomal protein S16